MRRISAVSLLFTLALLLGGCGKKTKKSKSKPAPTPAAMAPAPLKSPPPEVRPTAPASPVGMGAPLTPIPTVVKLQGEAKSLVVLVESALRNNKPEKVVALLATQEMIKGCPQLAADTAKLWGSFDKSIKRTAQQVRKAFKQCMALGSWARAKRISVRQTATKPAPAVGCKYLVEHGHIYLSYVIGNKSVTVKLASPARVNSKRWALLDGLRCRLAGDVYR
jgi:hypothetical protein